MVDLFLVGVVRFVGVEFRHGGDELRRPSAQGGG